MAGASEIVALPPMALYPTRSWRNHLSLAVWETCLDAWIKLVEAHLSLSDAAFIQISLKDKSLTGFLSSFVTRASNTSDGPDLHQIKTLRKCSFLLVLRLFDTDKPTDLLRWEFLADLARLYGRNNGKRVVGIAWKRHNSKLELSLGVAKSALTKDLDAGLKGNLRETESTLKQLNQLLNVSPQATAFFMAGSDFVDSLVSCYKLMNPPLRKLIVSTLYLCLIGLTESEKPQFSILIDQLYSLKGAAEAHRTGPTNANDSLIAIIVSQTPILKQIQQRLPPSDHGRAKSVLASLDEYKLPGVNVKIPERMQQRRLNKEKHRENTNILHSEDGQFHVHRMTLITQVQDLFPNLGSGFVVKLLDEYDENVEQVIAHLLEDSLPVHLKSANQSEELELVQQRSSDLVIHAEPQSTIYEPSHRRNVFDNDELDRLAVNTSRLHFGSRNPGRTADDVLQDRTDAPNKAAILSALAAFDTDDDERDDTYDVEDVGGTVDSAVPGSNPEEANADANDTIEETLFKAYKATPDVFSRDATTRRGKARAVLRDETGMTDEAIEGWSVMLGRDPRKLRRLEAQFSTFHGAQRVLESTAWKSSPVGSGTEDSDVDSSTRGRGGHRGRGRGARSRGGGRGGSVSGPTGEKETEQARQRKEANKASRANHNRRDQRAKKLARGGFGL